MRFINKYKCIISYIMLCSRLFRFVLIFLIILPGLLLSACSNRNIPLAYEVSTENSAFKMFDILDEVPRARSFASDLIVVPGNFYGDVDQELMEAAGIGLFGTSEKEVLYAKDVYERLSPASLTKIMTALVALEFGVLDTYITASANVNISEARAQTCGLERGDQLTLSQALHLSLINSANDAAIVVAEGVGNGSVEEFVQMMNRKAKALGATNTNFMNPHGLSHDDQYTTIYDMYLILNEAIKYDAFNQIIALPSYTTSYIRANGETRELSVQNTNQYLQDAQDYPNNITIIGGKTGTTQAAGHCLAIVAKNSEGKTYLSIIMRAETRDDVYGQTTELLRQIVN